MRFGITGALIGLLMVAAVVLEGADCGGQAPENGGTMYGAYSYTGYDSSGHQVVSGSLVLARVDSVNFRGSWHLMASEGASGIGPQSGSGQLAGNIESHSTILINLNPGFADNNVFLQGEMGYPSFRGTWEWSTLTGRTNYGSFTAVHN